MMSRIARFELLAMTLLLLSYIWGWQNAFRGDSTALGLLFLSIGVTSHWRRRESPGSLGFRFDNFAEAVTISVAVLAPLVVASLAVGWGLGSFRFPTLEEWPRKLLWGLFWGTLQQYALVAFYYRRLRETLDGSWPPMLATAATFALFHLPNPFLTALTFVAGAASCWLYRRVPNLFVLGAAHALISFCVSRSLPVTLTLGFKVGPGALILI